MFSSSWSMPLFTFLLGMLVIRLKKEAFSWGDSSHSSTPPCSHNQCYLQQLLCQHSLFCLLYHFYTLHIFVAEQDLAISDNSGKRGVDAMRIYSPLAVRLVCQPSAHLIDRASVGHNRGIQLSQAYTIRPQHYSNFINSLS